MPLVSVLLAVHNGAPYCGAAVQSVLRQTLAEFELIVVDDASTDDTARLLSGFQDSRLKVLTNEEQLGLAASLNRGLDVATGRYIARLDADDVACPRRFERQLARFARDPELGVVGSAVLDLDPDGRPGVLHRNPLGPRGVRWRALFGSPFFHPTVLVVRDLLEANSLRYDTAYLESEDYDLWTRLLAFTDGANLAMPLTLKRVHPGQASLRRGDLQATFQEQVALREIGRIAPDLDPDQAQLAWTLGNGRRLDTTKLKDAAESFLSLLASFEGRHGVDPEVRASAARTLVGSGLMRQALSLGARHQARLIFRGVSRRSEERRSNRRVRAFLSTLTSPPQPWRVAVISPEPTPYRSPLFDRVAAQDEVDLTVIYAARTVAGRTWSVEPHHRTVFLRGTRLPGLRRVLRHDYPVTPGIARALRDADPAVVVVSGWSTFAAQAAVAWCLLHRVPYVSLVESHDLGPRSGWRRAVKGAVVPRVMAGAASVLVVGSAARESVVARGASPDRVRVFANTVDVPAWSRRADLLVLQRPQLRSRDGWTDEDIIVLSVGRLVPEKGLDTLIRGAAASGDPRLQLVFAGGGPEASSLARLAQGSGVRVLVRGDLTEDELAVEYARADVFALLSHQETWGVVVNEAAASALPLVLSERVGAAHDLLRDRDNGFLVPSGDVAATARALRALAEDRSLRQTMGARSRELVRDWGYGPSVESFVAAVREATSR